MKRIALILAASLVLFGCSDGNRDAVTFAATEKDVTDQVQQKQPQDDAASGTDEDDDAENSDVSVPSTPSTGDGNISGSGTSGTSGSTGSSGTGDGNTDSGGQTSGQVSGDITDNGDGTCTYKVPLRLPQNSDGKIIIPNTIDGKTVNKVEYDNSKHLESIGVTAFEVGEGNKHFCTADGVLFSDDKKTLILFPDGREGDYTIPKYVETIGAYAFKSCRKLTSITVESGSDLRTISLWAFGNLSNVTIDLSNADKIVQIGGSAFSKYDKVEVIVANDTIAKMVSSQDANINVTVKPVSAQ